MSTFPGFDQIFVMHDDMTSGALTVRSIGGLRGMDFLRGHAPAGGRVSFKRHLGKRPLDYVTAADRGFRLLSPRTLSLLEREGFTGWRTYGVDIESKGISGSLDGYGGLTVVGRCGPVQREFATREQRATRVPGGWEEVSVGLFFDPSTWDGSDVFMPEDRTSFVLIQERVRLAFLEAGPTNFRFTRATEWVFPG